MSFGLFRPVLLAVCLVASPVAVAQAAPAVSFAPKTDYPTGANSKLFAIGGGPASVAIGDVNGDHIADVVMANNVANTVSVLLGDGAGGFAAHADYPAGDGAYSVAIRDLNGDHAADLVVADVNAGTMSVLLGTGTGAFPTCTAVAAGTWPVVTALDDIDHDGRCDAAVVNYVSSTVRVLFGDGAGGFPAWTDYPTGAGPTDVLLTDMNADGNADLVVANNNAATVSVRLGDGTGGFGASTDYPAGAGVFGLAAGDLNAGGVRDLAAATYGANRVSVFLGAGAGELSAKTDFVTAIGPTSVAIADFNGDGAADLVVTAQPFTSVSVLLGDGAGGFAAAVDFPTGIHPTSVAIADFNNDGRPDLAVSDLQSNAVSILLNTTPGSSNPIQPGPVPSCISSAHPRVTVPIAIARTDATPVRGVSATIQLSANLALCATPIASIREGSYLSAIGATAFEITDLGGGTYTVDCSILGVPCGQSAAAGTLFTVDVKANGPDGTGTITVLPAPLEMVDCPNALLPVSAGPPASLTIQTSAPAAVTALSASQVLSGNDADGTTQIALTFAPPAGAIVEVYRAAYGNYPEYDDAPNAGSVPAVPAYPPPTPLWTRTLVAASGDHDEPPVRDVWYYVAFAVDACGNVSAASPLTGGTLNYHLGDVHNGVTDCQGNNLVTTADLSYLGAHYGITVGAGSPYACLDVGPTATRGVDARPTTDDKVNFEDLIVLAINFGTRSAPVLASVVTGSSAIGLAPPAGRYAPGETFDVPVQLAGGGDLQGLSVDLGYDAHVVEPVGVTRGALLDAQARAAVALSPQPGRVDIALLGAGPGLAGDGTLAVVTFRVLAAGDPQLTIAHVIGRDAANRDVDVNVRGGAPAVRVPTTAFLGAAFPNPCARQVVIPLGLPAAGLARLEIYDLRGRLVRTLLAGPQPAGVQHVGWDGRDARGHGIGAGSYLVCFRAPGRDLTTRLQVIR